MKKKRESLGTRGLYFETFFGFSTKNEDRVQKIKRVEIMCVGFFFIVGDFFWVFDEFRLFVLKSYEKKRSVCVAAWA